MTVLYNRIADQIQELIQQGAYRTGDRLPGVRVLSRQFGVSIATILQSHQVLEGRGFVDARERSGYYVRLPPSQTPVPTVDQVQSRPTPVSARELAVEMVRAAQDRTLVPLGAAVPHSDFMPMRQMQQAASWAARLGRDAQDYAFPGKLVLRRQIAQRMTALGAPTVPDQLLITTGAQEAITIALRSVTKPGDIVALESPFFPGILHSLELLGLRVIEIPSDPTQGISLEGLQLALEQWPVAACIVVVNHSNPLGCRLSDARKQRLVRMLSTAKVPLIEDDIYGDLPLEGERPRPAKAFDKEGNVLYCGSFSKTLSPGMRIGWLQPGRYLEEALQQKYFMNIATSTIPQLAVAHFLEQNGYERFLRSVRQRYAEALERMRTAVGHYFPEGTAVSRPVGGFVLWVQMPDGCDGTEIFRQALGEGISVAHGRLFSLSDKFQNCLRLNGANPWDEKIEKALKRMGEMALLQASKR